MRMSREPQMGKKQNRKRKQSHQSHWSLQAHPAQEAVGLEEICHSRCGSSLWIGRRSYQKRVRGGWHRSSRIQSYTLGQLRRLQLYCLRTISTLSLRKVCTESRAVPTVGTDIGTTFRLPRLIRAGITSVEERLGQVAEAIGFTRPTLRAASDSITATAWNIALRRVAVGIVAC